MSDFSRSLDGAKAKSDALWTVVTALMWIYFAIASYGAGESYGPFLAFFGMFVWATERRYLDALSALQERTSELCDEAINGWQGSTERTQQAIGQVDQLLAMLKRINKTTNA
jgi:hypothetical protein